MNIIPSVLKARQPITAKQLYRRQTPGGLVLRWAVFVATIGAVLAIALPALAEPSVLLIVQAGIDQDPAPCELRLRSELAAEGLEVVTASSRTTQNLIDLEGLARRTGAIAGLSAFVDAQSIEGRLWVSDPSSHVDLVRTLRVLRTEGDPVAVFALRAVEALRGARLELEQQKRKLAGATSGSTDSAPNGGAATTAATSSSASNAADSAPVPPRPKKASAKGQNLTEPRDVERKPTNSETHGDAAWSPRWLVEAHGTAGWELNDVGALLGPGADLRCSISPAVAVGLSFDGPLFSKVSYRSGSVVRVNQELVTAQLRWSVIRLTWGSLDLIGATGASRFGVRGEAPEPMSGLSTHAFEWLVGAGVGIGMPLSSRLRLGVDALWLRRLPAPVIVDRQPTRDFHLTGGTDSLLLGKLGVGLLF